MYFNVAAYTETNHMKCYAGRFYCNIEHTRTHPCGQTEHSHTHAHTVALIHCTCISTSVSAHAQYFTAIAYIHKHTSVPLIPSLESTFYILHHTRMYVCALLSFGLALFRLHAIVCVRVALQATSLRLVHTHPRRSLTQIPSIFRVILFTHNDNTSHLCHSRINAAYSMWVLLLFHSICSYHSGV